MYDSSYLILTSRGVHRLGWVRLKSFFNPTYCGRLKNIQHNPTQPIIGVQHNPTQPTWIELGWVGPMGWIFFLITIIIIIIKLSIRIPPPQKRANLYPNNPKHNTKQTQII